jgi:hypothetical protein
MRDILIDAICGSTVPLELINELQDRGLGHWTGGHVDRWTWKRNALHDLSTEQLEKLYQLLHRH